jgi:hypothetical protein
MLHSFREAAAIRSSAASTTDRFMKHCWQPNESIDRVFRKFDDIEVLDLDAVGVRDVFEFLLANASAGSHTSMPSTGSAGRHLATSGAIPATPVPTSGKVFEEAGGQRRVRVSAGTLGGMPVLESATVRVNVMPPRGRVMQQFARLGEARPDERHTPCSSSASTSLPSMDLTLFVIRP